MLFTVGLNLWLEISEKIKAADETFVTIGMAEQKEQSTVMEQWWDAGLKDYMYQETRGYGEYLTPDILESLDIEYISPPRQRPYFGAVSPGNRTGGELKEESITGVSLAEIRPLEDCVPDRPVPVEVVRVLWGTRSLLGKKIYFCDHRTEQPDSLKDIIAEKYADPFQISYTLGEELYIAVGYGEQPSGGYSISVNSFYETDDTLVIDTTLIGPGKAENVTKTPTRPYIVVKTQNIADKMIEFK